MFIPTAGFQVAGIGPWQYLLTQFGVITGRAHMTDDAPATVHGFGDLDRSRP